MTETKMIGKVVQAIGPVVDVRFEGGHMPEIFNALKIKMSETDGNANYITAEVASHLGENVVRAVSMHAYGRNNERRGSRRYGRANQYFPWGKARWEGL